MASSSVTFSYLKRLYCSTAGAATFYCMEQFIHVPESSKESAMQRFKALRQEMQEFCQWCRDNSMTIDDRESELVFLYLKMAELKEDVKALFRTT